MLFECERISAFGDKLGIEPHHSPLEEFCMLELDLNNHRCASQLEFGI